MAKKKSDKPKTVLLPIDRLSIQVGFIDNVRAGMLFKLIVYYCMSDSESVQHLLEQVKGMSESSIVLMAFEENKAIIDECLSSYADKCEKNRKIALEREERKRAYYEAKNTPQTSTNVKHPSTNVNERERQDTNTYTDTCTNTCTDTNTCTNSSSLHSEEVCVCQKNESDSVATPTPPDPQEIYYNKFLKRLSNECPTVALLKMPNIKELTQIYIASGRNWDFVFKICSEMENKPDLLKKNKIFITAYNNFKKHS